MKTIPHRPCDGRASFGPIAVTGASGPLGQLLIRRLHRTDEVTAIDPRPCATWPADVAHVETDLRRKDCRDLFRRRNVKAVVHLGADHAVLQGMRRGDAFARAVENFTRLLEYCVAYNVEKVVLVSSADVYGARAHNPQFFTEDAPLLAADLSILRHLDMMAQGFFWKQPEIETVILRPTHVAGAVDSVMSRYLRLSPVPVLLGYDPMIQLVHEEDLVRAIRLALGTGHRGIFNLAGPPPLPLRRIVERLGRPTVPLSHTLARPLVSRLYRLGRMDVAPSYLDHLRFVCMVDDSRARERLGYEPLRDQQQTIEAVDLWS